MNYYQNEMTDVEKRALCQKTYYAANKEKIKQQRRERYARQKASVKQQNDKKQPVI